MEVIYEFISIGIEGPMVEDINTDLIGVLLLLRNRKVPSRSPGHISSVSEKQTKKPTNLEYPSLKRCATTCAEKSVRVGD